MQPQTSPGIMQQVSGSAGRVLAQIRQVEAFAEAARDLGLIRKVNPSTPSGNILLIVCRYQSLPILGGYLYGVSSTVHGYSATFFGQDGHLTHILSDDLAGLDDIPASDLKARIALVINEQVRAALERATLRTGKPFAQIVVFSSVDPGAIGAPYLWFAPPTGGGEFLESLSLGESMDSLNISALEPLLAGEPYRVAQSAIGSDRVIKGMLEPGCRTASRLIPGGDLEFWLKLSHPGAYRVRWRNPPKLQKPPAWKNDRTDWLLRPLDQEIAGLLAFLLRLPPPGLLAEGQRRRLQQGLEGYSKLVLASYQRVEAAWLEDLGDLEDLEDLQELRGFP